MAKKTERPRKPTKMETITIATTQDHAHEHSLRLASRRRMWQFEMHELDNELIGLAAAVARAKDRRAVLVAKIAGVEVVLGKRA